MGGSSKSSTSNITEETIFNNIDYGDGGDGGESGQLAKNINMSDSMLKTGNIYMTDGGIAKAGIAATGESFKQLLNTSEKLVGDGYEGLRGTQEFAKEALASAVSAVTGSQQAVDSQLDRVLSYANASTRSDTSQSFENIARYGLLAVGTVAAVWILRGK